MRLVYKFNFTDNSNYLNNLCIISKNLYNQANYLIKQELNTNKKWLRYNDLDKLMKVTKNLEGNINYRLLKSQVAQHVLKLLDKNWTSYFRSIKRWKINKDKYKGMPKPPNYCKNELNLLIYTNQSSKIKDDKIHLSKDFIIDIPKYKDKDFTKFQQIRILPTNIKNQFEVEIVYKQDIKNEVLNYDKYSSIDLGLNNLVTLVSENKPILFNGNILKSYNQFYNKQKAKLCSVKDKMKNKYYTRRLYGLEKSRNNYIKDYLHKVSRLIINYLVKNKIGNLVIGHNKQWKNSINIGHKNNQTFVTIPHSQLINYLKYKSELCGIKVQEVEESYTSKCDSLALESVQKQDSYLGKRIKRGLFQSSTNRLINADVNGALNIMRKVVDDFYVSKIINSGLLFNPVKIRNLFSDSLLNFSKV